MIKKKEKNKLSSCYAYFSLCVCACVCVCVCRTGGSYRGVCQHCRGCIQAGRRSVSRKQRTARQKAWHLSCLYSSPLSSPCCMWRAWSQWWIIELNGHSRPPWVHYAPLHLQKYIFELINNRCTHCKVFTGGPEEIPHQDSPILGGMKGAATSPPPGDCIAN